MEDIARIKPKEEDAPGIAPEGKTQQQGQCRYCKQYMMVWAPSGTSQEELNKMAEEDCNCAEGEPARKQAYEDAYIERQIIEYEFESEEIKGLIQKLAYAVSHFVIKKSQIVTQDSSGNEITYSISKKKGVTEIKRKVSIIENIGYAEE